MDTEGDDALVASSAAVEGPAASSSSSSSSSADDASAAEAAAAAAAENDEAARARAEMRAELERIDSERQSLQAGKSLGNPKSQRLRRGEPGTSPSSRARAIGCRNLVLVEVRWGGACILFAELPRCGRTHAPLYAQML